LVKTEEMELIKPKNELGFFKPMYIGHTGQEKFHKLPAYILKFAKLTAL
jgi:hypothetical protein